MALSILLTLEMFSSRGKALKGSYEIWGEISSKNNTFDLLRLNMSLINFHLKVKKKKNPQNVGIISRLSCQHHNLQETLHLPIQTLYLFTTLADLEKEKKSPHHFWASLLFYINRWNIWESVLSKWATCKKLDNSELRNFHSHFVHVKNWPPHYFPLLPLAFLTLAAFSKWSTFPKTSRKVTWCQQDPQVFKLRAGRLWRVARGSYRIFSFEQSF